jgi:SAM-dependent methyltransferase
MARASSMVNIGCGTIHHSDWINLDIASDDPTVLTVDITKGLPFSTTSLSACYSSHVLEHMDKASANFLLSECFRVLASGGILRLVVPDLEGIVREYLEILEQLIQGDISRAKNYEWIMLEMYDQVARKRPGGEMMEFLTSLDPADRSYVVKRIGGEAERIWQAPAARPASLTTTAKLLAWRKWCNRFRLKLTRVMVRLLAGKAAADSFTQGLFRSGGEIHQWMYDRYSLGKLLEQSGFTDIKVCSAEESRIEKFASYQLDSQNGQVRKPDSLFIEAVKP